MDIHSVGNIYKNLNKFNLHTLEDIYHNDVIFEDAAHRVEGWTALRGYFDNLYTNVIRCDFDVHEHQQVGNVGFLIWTMTLQHPKLKKGALIEVKGISHLKIQDDKIIYHRDYFDLGEMLYENLPLLGSVIKSVKQRLGQ
ncbi:nuclear transport factor 2 family protein [Vibrio sagamiensis]|uniref:Transcriptional regulator n=1 Tax=Vibrio sagamiensis NBRC 104589 TaxID=1219064 RepID=A0A511QJ90_9VIBR|nr:nuclear transport factor 2 family protein [Vibrio sagamiensis]PNQ70435.1 nuclear transport factor 2 family protein [Vibrio agarivorans]GEM77136.1 transcriptional regulator [Vibrio sagamiensis NBRC 104589]